MPAHAVGHPLWVAVTRAACIAAPAMLSISHVLAAEPAHTQPQQSAESFEAALRERSTSQLYILLTVVDDATGQARTGCTMGPFLLGALQIEYGLGSGEAGNAKALNVALANPDHVFHFSKPEALANLPFRYSSRDIEAARQEIKPLTDQQLREGLNIFHGKLQPTGLGGERDALACALIERGLSVRMADISGSLILEP